MSTLIVGNRRAGMSVIAGNKRAGISIIIAAGVGSMTASRFDESCINNLADNSKANTDYTGLDKSHYSRNKRKCFNKARNKR